MTKPTDKVPGKNYTYSDMILAQMDFEKARLGSSFESKKRTEQMIEKINQRRENAK